MCQCAPSMFTEPYCTSVLILVALEMVLIQMTM